MTNTAEIDIRSLAEDYDLEVKKAGGQDGLGDPNSRSIRLQDFVLDGRPFVPVFSDDAHFRRECAGSGFEDRGVSMDANLLASIIRDDLLLILNPASPTPVELRRADLLPHLRAGVGHRVGD